VVELAIRKLEATGRPAFLPELRPTGTLVPLPPANALG
jgi:hypothetical protein